MALYGPTQLLMPGRGIEPAWAEFPGTAQPGSEHSSGTYERGVATALYAQEHPEVDLIVFSGKCSFMLPEADVPEGSEAHAAATVAKEVGIPKHVTVVEEDKSDTTFKNWLRSRRYFDLAKPIGTITHPDHAKRVDDAGGIVLPYTEIISLPVAVSEDGRSGSSLVEKVAPVLYWLCMRSINPLDYGSAESEERAKYYASIERGDERAKRIALTALAGKAALTNLLHHGQQQASA